VSHRGSSSSAMALESPPHRRSPVENLSRHFAGMMQDGLQIAVPLEGGGRGARKHASIPSPQPT
jgi:hypothetical protein